MTAATPPTVAGDSARLILTYEGSKLAVLNPITGKAVAIGPDGWPMSSAGAVRYLPASVTAQSVAETDNVPLSVRDAALTEVASLLRKQTEMTVDEAAYWLIEKHSDCGLPFLVDAMLLFARDKGDTLEGHLLVNSRGSLLMVDPETGAARVLR